MGVPSAWTDQKMAAAHLLAAVRDLEAMGCYSLEYPVADPKWHIGGSRHSATGFGGRACASDVNRDPRGVNSGDERKWFEKYGQHIALGHGLSLTCGLYGFVTNHSGANMHLHIDDGPYMNDGSRGPRSNGWVNPRAGKPTLPAWPVRAFQKKRGLVADGIPGPLTSKKLQGLVGVEQDGILGRISWTAIQKKIGAVPDGIPGGETYFKLGLAIEKGIL